MAVTDQVLSVAQIRAAEAHTMTHTSEATLMDRAAAHVAEACTRLAPPGSAVMVLAGSGNNGGDALLAGALLAGEGYRVVAAPLATTIHERGLRELTAAGGALSTTPGEEVAAADLVIDGIVGIGSRPGLRDDAARLVEQLACPVVAVDLPSGLDADSGAVSGAHVRATVTVTFTAPKACLAAHPAAASCGEVSVVDVGIDL